ncbi:MAG: 1-acyl-sn-glycerol-3-phosphate acyltransferase, partial [Treponema sp.]|nr:1-acyl-sn-glycerol-3-phosphate acyltransferase [Treponema sp.]
GYLGKPMTFVAKAELGKIPLLSDWMRMLQCTFIVRNNPRKSIQAIKDAAQGVKKGYSQVIFPEGPRSRGGPHHEFKAGSFKLAFLSKSPIVPFTIEGTYKIFEEKKKVCPGQHVKITIHDPIETEGLSREEQNAIPAQVEKIVCANLP